MYKIASYDFVCFVYSIPNASFLRGIVLFFYGNMEGSGLDIEFVEKSRFSFLAMVVSRVLIAKVHSERGYRRCIVLDGSFVFSVLCEEDIG